MAKERRIKITRIHKEDAFYVSRDRYIGTTGMFVPGEVNLYPGYFYGNFYPEDKSGISIITFIGIRYKRI